MFMGREYILNAYIFKALRQQGESAAHEKSGPFGPLLPFQATAAAVADVA
ncbi:hypothetical protein [uncultured Variovorax sp.]|nr:hypothetical protein [uncultured Variovorax sp.]